MELNPEALKYVAAYVGGTLLGVVGSSLAINKIRETFDPNYNKPVYYPADDGTLFPKELQSLLK